MDNDNKKDYVKVFKMDQDDAINLLQGDIPQALKDKLPPEAIKDLRAKLADFVEGKYLDRDKEFQIATDICKSQIHEAMTRCCDLYGTVSETPHGISFGNALGGILIHFGVITLARTLEKDDLLQALAVAVDSIYDQREEQDEAIKKAEEESRYADRH